MKNKRTSSAAYGDSALEHLELALARKTEIKAAIKHLMESKREIQKQLGINKLPILPKKAETRWSKQLARLMKRETELYGKLAEVVALTRTIPARRLKPFILTSNINTLSVIPAFSNITEDIEFQKNMSPCVWCASDCTSNCTSDCTTNCTSDCTTACTSGCTFSADGKYMQHDKRLRSNSSTKVIKLRQNGDSQFLIDWD